MRYLMKRLASPIKFTDGFPASASSANWNPQNMIKYGGSNIYPRTLYALSGLLQHFGSGSASMAKSLSGPKCEMGSPQRELHGCLAACRRFSSSAGKEQPLSRDWFARLWVEEKRKLEGLRRVRRKRQPASCVEDGGTLFDTFTSQLPFLKSVLRKPAAIEPDVVINKTMREPPISQYDGDILSPSSPEEVSC